MAYRIAVATSDGTNVDLAFDEADSFRIYEVADDNQTITLLETRAFQKPAPPSDTLVRVCTTQQQSSCGSGCGGGSQRGCGGADFPKVRLLTDCRSILCRSIGFRIRKQFEKNGVVVFDIEYGLEKALGRIVRYFAKTDSHQNWGAVTQKGNQDT